MNKNICTFVIALGFVSTQITADECVDGSPQVIDNGASLPESLTYLPTCGASTCRLHFQNSGNFTQHDRALSGNFPVLSAVPEEELRETTRLILYCGFPRGGGSGNTFFQYDFATALDQPAPEPEPEPTPPTPPVGACVNGRPQLADGGASLPGSLTYIPTCGASSCRLHFQRAGNFTQHDRALSGNIAILGSVPEAELRETTQMILFCGLKGDGGSGNTFIPYDFADALNQPPQPAAVNLSASQAGVPLNGSVTLNWTSSGTNTCQASGAWSGNRPTNGSQVVGPIARDSTYTLTCSGDGGRTATSSSAVSVRTAKPTWTGPTENIDGSSANIVSYRVYYGPSSGNYTNSVDVENPAMMAQIPLRPGIYYFAITAISAEGFESDFSNEMVRTVQ